MSRLTSAAVALSLLAMASASAAQQSAPPEVLDGVDVVILVQQGKEVFGKSAHRTTYRGLDYLFSSPETKTAFETSPEKYAVQLGGLCARMAGTVTGNPSNYVLHEDRIYLFASDTCRKLFLETPAKYLPRPPAPFPTGADALARGRALLDKAAEAHGGAHLDAITTYVESSTVVRKRPTGDVAFVTKNMWRFPGGARSERTIPLASGPMIVTTLLVPDGAWEMGGGQSRRVRPAAVPAVEMSLGRQLLPLLRSRKDPALQAAALEPATVSGLVVERVRVKRAGLDLTLNIDAASGRVHSASYVDRSDQGEVGDIVMAFTDYRAVDGVTIPFAENVTFNGAPSPALSRTLDTAVVNPPLDSALFGAPADGR